MAADVYSELEWRGLIHQVTDPALKGALSAGTLTAYCGFDPTASSLTTAHLLQLLTLRRLQLGGHRPIALAGGGTGLIGDPSGRDTERSLLDLDQVEANVANIKIQLEHLLDFAPGPAGAMLLNNADWLAPLRLIDFLRDVGKSFSMNMMLGKDSVRRRLDDREQGLSYAEFSYMLFQAYDFLYLFENHDCTLQIGGSDQWGNIVSGIDLIRRRHGTPAYGLTTPLLVGPDGKKMSKSEGGAVWLDPNLTSPYAFYQFWFNTPDESVVTYLKFFTFLPRERIEELAAAVEAHPSRREAQKVLATEMTTLIHGNEATVKAIAASKALFGAEIKDLDEPTLLEVVSEAPSSEQSRTALGEGIALVDLLVTTGLAGSKSEARQHIEGGGTYINNIRETDPGRTLSGDDLLHGRYILLRRGKKTYHLVKAQQRAK